MTVSSLLEEFSLEDEGSSLGTFSCLHVVRIGSRMMSNGTHCSVMSPSASIAFIQEAKGVLITNLCQGHSTLVLSMCLKTL